MSCEQWSEVESCPGILVSDLGRVRGARGGIMKPQDLKGYRRVFVRSADGPRKSFLVHKLVMEGFHGVCPDGQEVDHIDRNKGNNKLGNLRYVSHRENMLHSKAADKDNKKYGRNSRLSERDVRGVRILRRNTDMTYSEISELFGIRAEAVSAIVRGKTWGHVK